MRTRFGVVLSALLLVAIVTDIARAQMPAPPLASTRATQPPGSIMGVVKADSLGPALAGAAVTIRTAGDSAVLTGGLTDNAGRFKIDGLAPGNYQVRISYIGYKPFTVEAAITPGALTANVGTVALKTEVIAIDGVTAEATKSAVTVQPDRTVYNVKDMPAASGGTTTDVLRNIPELDVDIEGNVKLQGSQSVAVHINGRPTPLKGDALKNFLQTMPANRIDKVEVVPNPSAKYDPEGIAGILNIVTKGDLDLGFSGSFSLNADATGRHGTSGNLNWQKGRLTLFGNAAINRNHNNVTNTDLRQNIVANTFYSNISRSEMNGFFSWFDGSAEFKLNKETTLFASGRGNLSKNGMDGLSQYAILDALQNPTFRYDNNLDNNFHWKNNNASVGVRRVIKPQQDEMTLEFRRNGNGFGSDNTYFREYLNVDGTASGTNEFGVIHSGNDVAEYIAQFDLTKPLTAAIKLEAGYKAAHKGTDYTNGLERFAGSRDGELISSQDNPYDYNENYHQLYTTLSRSFGKFGVQVGARGEIARTEFALPTGQSYDKEYENIYPSLNVSFNPKEGWSTRFSYSKRLDRPRPDMLNPLVPTADSLNRFVGNPDIEPQYTHSYTFDVTKMGAWGMFKVAPYFRKTVNNWDYFKFVDDKGAATLTWENTDEVLTYGGNATLSLRKGATSNGFINFNLYRFERTADNINNASYSGEGTRWSLSANGMTTLRPGTTVQAFASYQAPMDLPQGRMASSVWSNLGLRHQFMDKKASFNLNVNDPFGLARWKFETADATHVQKSSNKFTMRTVRAGFTYNFGKPPQPTVRRNNEDQQQGGDSAPAIR